MACADDRRHASNAPQRIAIYPARRVRPPYNRCVRATGRRCAATVLRRPRPSLSGDAMDSGRCVTLVLAAGLAVAANAPMAQAQRGQPRPIELGIDAALAYDDGDNISRTSFTIPVPRFRVGFFMSDGISLEPFFSLQYARTEFESDAFEQSVSVTQYDLGLGLRFHFASDRTRSQPYLRPFVGISGLSVDDDDDDVRSEERRVGKEGRGGWWPC